MTFPGQQGPVMAEPGFRIALTATFRWTHWLGKVLEGDIARGGEALRFAGNLPVVCKVVPFENSGKGCWKMRM